MVKTKIVLIKEPILSSLSAPSSIASGETAKFTVRLSGKAPASGIVVNVTVIGQPVAASRTSAGPSRDTERLRCW